MRRAAYRVHIIGTSGSGKTTLARRVAARLDVPHVELDALHWQAGWVGRDDEGFSQALVDATAGRSWVVCGNYERVARPVLQDRLTHWVWLDYARWRVMWRVLYRSVARAWTKRELWAGNRESFRLTFFSRDSVIWWSIKTHGPNRRKYAALFAELEKRVGIEAVRLRSPREAERWLSSI